MTTNQGFLAQASDLPLSKGSFSAATGVGAGAGPFLLNPGPGGGAATAGPPALGGLGLLVPGGVNYTGLSPFAPAPSPGIPLAGLTGQQLSSVLQTISKLGISYTSPGGADAAKLVQFTLWVQRQTLLNAAAVAAESAIPTYGPPALAPVATPIASGLFAAGAAGVQQQFVDFSGQAGFGNPDTQAWDVVEGDVYFLQVSTPVALVGSLTNVMVSLG